MSWINRRKFISATIGGAIVTAAAIQYYQYTGKSLSSPTLSVDPNITVKPKTTDNADLQNSSAPPSPPPPPSNVAYLAVARGKNPTEIVRSVINSLGGIDRFVKSGDDVIIKPNICVPYRTYEYAATTNPEVVGTLTALSLEAGAKRVRVMDNPFGGGVEKAYSNSGIEAAVRGAGGKMEVMSDIKYREVDIPYGKDIKRWQIYGDILDADVLINVPVAKQHSLGRLTLGMKNLMGIIQHPSSFHSNLGQRLADLATLVRPTLTVIDAVRILTNHGPTGGNLSDVKKIDTVIASHDIVAADVYAATLFGLAGSDIPAINAGAQMGLGTMELNKIKIEETDV